MNALSKFLSIAELPANSTAFTDAAIVDNSLYYYRVRAYRDTISSFSSDTARITYGNYPFLMKDTVITTCNRIFLDPGGEDIIPAIYKATTTTFRPSTAGDRVR